MDNKSIHLVNIVPSVNKNGLIHIPYGILYIGSHLRRAGFDVKIHHFNEFQMEQKAKEIADLNPLWVGLSVLTGLTTLYSADFSKKLKTISDTKIVWGGHHPSLEPEQTLRQNYVDFVGIGFGEDLSVELSQALTEGGDLNHIHGLGFKKDGTMIFNPKRIFDKNIDRFTIDWSLLDITHYLQHEDGKTYLAIFSSRGCPYNCGFCSTRMYSGSYWAGHSTDYIMDLVNSLERLTGPIGIIGFSDDNVMIDKERGFHIINCLKSHGIQADYINLRINQLTPEVVEFFKTHKVRSIFFGFESGVHRILKLMNKQLTPEQIVDKVNLLQGSDMVVVASGILGLPTETEEEMKENIQFALRIWKLIPKGAVSLFRFMPLPGTDLTKLAMECGFQAPVCPEDWKKVDPQGPFYEMPWLTWVTPKKLKKLEQTQTMIRNYFPKKNLEHVPFLVKKYFLLWIFINQWRLKYQWYSGFNVQKIFDPMFLYKTLQMLRLNKFLLLK